MAAEFERLAADFLRRLPEDHADRPFLAGIHAAVTAYAEPSPVEPAPAENPDTALPLEPVPPAETAEVAVPVEAPAAAPEQERVTLRGRIGARPRFSTTPRGVRRAEFNLAVHQDDESTSWHTVLAFRERAERLEQANPQKGQQAEVIGYRRLEERTDRAGNPRTVERIIAAHVRLR